MIANCIYPSPVKEIWDTQCGLCFTNMADTSHIAWINENRIGRYYPCDLFQKNPWTQLGYTYDWNPRNKSHVGLSEFVIDRNKNVIINGIY